MSDSLILSLGALFLLTFLGNGLIPLPITAFVLWMGRFHAPLPVIVVGTLGSTLGWVIMGDWLNRWLSGKPDWTEKVSKSLPSCYRTFFTRWPSLSILVFNALPLPWDPMRFLALVFGLDPKRLALPLALGRCVRYTLLVYAGMALSPSPELFWGAIVLFLLLPMVTKAGLNYWRQASTSTENDSTAKIR